MNADKQLLEQQIDVAIANYEEQRKQNRRRSANVAVVNASMAAITTVLIGLSNTWKSTGLILSSLAIVTSALVMVISGWDRIYNHKRLWILYTEAWILMKEIKLDLSHISTTPSQNQEAINDIYSRYKKVMRQLNDQWMSMKSEDKG